ncbi:hypothetical protein GXP70_09310 [Paenibacillus lycopersici]|uniref:Sporulation membrane protein YtrI C-terminal domain-containing protein n=1 Tax=Paenibacillus lycopersici TaxID=2704462 RepID=A0A6C0FYS3_9BACL|nr:hypothetical protein [Paenibacillus lycopersici]QHT60119.1 hypothetical protein GXP70_09310 [Paenibacillus lycopersici]
MRVPPFERFTRLMAASAYVVLGTIIGAMLYHAVFFMNFNALRDTNTELEGKLSEYEDRIEKLDQFKNQHTVVKSIMTILLDGKDDESDKNLDEQSKLALKTQLKEDLSVFLGTSIYKINSNAELARLLLKHKNYIVGGNKEYTVEIHTVLVVDNVLQVWFVAKKYDRPLG